jgi:hypothetical protein
MGKEIFEPLVTIALAIVGLAIVAVLVSNKAQTGQVLGAGGAAFANAISSATAPVTGNAATPNVSGPAGGLGTLGQINLLGGGNLTGNLLG